MSILVSVLTAFLFRFLFRTRRVLYESIWTEHSTVMCRGRIVSSHPAKDWTEHSIITAAIGQCCLMVVRGN